MLREETRSVQVGNLTIGGNNHVVIQSMCNTKTKNVEATIKQINALEQAGCELVRVAVLLLPLKLSPTNFELSV